jgi:hypothetical protein
MALPFGGGAYSNTAGGASHSGLTTGATFSAGLIGTAGTPIVPWANPSWNTEHAADGSTLLLHHHEDNAANTVVVDSSANGWNSVSQNGNTNVMFTAGGRFNGGLHCDMGPGYFALNLNAACRVAVRAAASAVITVEIFIKGDTNNWSAIGNMGIFMVNCGFPNNLIDVRYSSGTDLITFTYAAGGVTKTITTNSITDTVNWHHLAVTVDVASDTFKVFIDGVQIGLTQTGLGVWNAAVSHIYIGCDTTAGNAFDGVIDEFAISNVLRY